MPLGGSSPAASRRCLRISTRTVVFGLQPPRRCTITTSHRGPLRLAIIGSGPAGYYSAYRIMKRLPESLVDMYETLPTPFGLVRFGVAPDHPEVKKSAETLVTVGEWANFTFIGNTTVGNARGQLPLTSIAPHYDALLFAYGASTDKKLEIPGENLKGVMSARDFVAWYNGSPDHASMKPDLESGDTAVVLGQGNVALDVARMLLAPAEHLRRTDISDSALEDLSRSRVRDVKVIGRRGPLQAPYGIKELRELMTLSGVGFANPPEGWELLIEVERARLPRQLRRIAELLEKGSRTPLQTARKAWQLGFYRSPVAFLTKNNGSLQAVGFERTEAVIDPASILTTDAYENLNVLRSITVKGTGQQTLIHTHLAFKSVGYRSKPLPGLTEIGVPFDEARAVIPNDRWGRVISPGRGPAGPLTAGHVPGMYCAGWVKRGPTGVIASTMDDAFNTADVIVEDWEANAKFIKGEGTRKQGFKGVEPEIQRRGIRTVSWQDWEKIDAEERRRGQLKGKPREKCKSVADMLAIID